MIAKERALENLKNTAWLQDEATQEIFHLLDSEQGRTKAVGGIVRDSLIGRNGAKTDIDFATEFLPQEVIERAKKANIAYYPTGIEHGTITLRIGKKTFEITTLRQDIETDGRHAKVQFGTDWLADARRRDFTINALYVDYNGELFDPLSGLKDCLAGKVIFIGNADDRIKEDRLRVFRFFRFSASHAMQKLDEVGLAACKRAANDLGNISAERVGAEMERMLSLKYIAKSLTLMSEIGVLSLNASVLEQLFLYEDFIDNPAFEARLAIILGQYEKAKLQKLWRLSNVQIKGAVNLLNGAKLLHENKINEVAYHYKDIIVDIVPLAGAIYHWEHKKLLETSRRLSAIKVPPFPISGKTLIDAGIEPSPKFGEIISRLESEWIESDFKLSKSDLLSKL
ncbi:MAG: hypothetical protein L3J15_02450 [Devosiaceae bacterium]|nr:hypothetical protein [Devosiaceae bacterium]